jgi:hypothetical protein
MELSLKKFMYLSLSFFYKEWVHEYIMNLVRKSDSKVFGLLLLRIAVGETCRAEPRRIPFKLRELISLAQPTNPLEEKNLPTIQIAIACHVKDFHNLKLVIEAAKKNVVNPISKFNLITPNQFVSELKSKFPDCTVLSDENVLGESTHSAIKEYFPLARIGWIIQQAIKLKVAISSEEVATLVLDADTVLLRPKVWLDSTCTQILSFSTEYNQIYKIHQRKMFGRNTYPLGFVTHHQLMIRDSLTKMFGFNGERIINWIMLADCQAGSPVSEYDTYGEWMLMNEPNKIAFSKWNNLGVVFDPGQISFDELSEKFAAFDSVSNHSYLERKL